MKRILLTGAAGVIGQTIAPALIARGHAVRGFDRNPMPELPDAVVADLTDRPAIDRAMEGIDTLLHLAAFPNDADFMGKLLEPNVIGLHHVVESAILAGVKRIVLASTVQVVVGKPAGHEGPAGTDVHWPINHYALTKLWAECLGEMTARVHGIEVIAARISWFVRNASEAARVNNLKHRAMYLSHGDARRFFTRAVEASLPAGDKPFYLVYAAGPGYDGRVYYDLEPSRRVLGYEPRDQFPNGLGFAWTAAE